MSMRACTGKGGIDAGDGETYFAGGGSVLRRGVLRSGVLFLE